MTIGRKILLLAFILLPVLLVAAYSFLETRNRFIKRIYEGRSTMASLVSNILKEKFDHLNDIALSLATRPVLGEHVDSKEWHMAIDLMKNVPTDFPNLEQIFIADTFGNIKASISGRSGMKNTNPSSFDWFKGVSKKWQPYLSGVYKHSDQPHINVAALAIPIKNIKGRLVGILVLQVNVTQLLQWSNEVIVGNSGSVYIVDQKGHIAINRDYQQTDTVVDYSSVAVVQHAMTGVKNVEILYNPIEKQNRLTAYEQVPGYKWAVIVQQEARAALPVFNSLRFIIMFYCTIITVAILIALYIIMEIERRKKSEDNLKNYVDMVENTQVLVRNIQNKIIFWNKGMENLYQWKKEEALGQLAHDLFTKDSAQDLIEIEKVLFEKGEWQGELKHIRKDGTELFVSSHWYLQRDKNGKPVAILESSNDITKIKKTEEILRKTEEISQLLTNSVKDYAIFMLSPDGTIASWNSGAEITKGYKAEEVIGKSLDIFYTDTDIKKGVPIDNLKMAREMNRYEDVGWRVRKDGSKFWADVIFTALWENGNLRGYSKVTRDITEKKKAEEQLSFLARQINQSNDAIYVVDKENKIISWNKGAEKIYGFSSGEALGVDSNELLKTDISEKEVDAALNRILEKGYWVGELKRRNRLGEEIHVRTSTTTIKDDEDRITGHVSVSVDITEQVQMREQVNHLATLVNQSGDAIVSVGLDGKIISWNRGSEKLHGYRQDETIGKYASGLGIFILTEREIAKVFITVLRNGSWQKEMAFYHKNGSSFWGAVNVSAVKNKAGEITSLVFIVKDVTVRKQLEEKLKKYNDDLEKKILERTGAVIKSERRFRALIENNHDMISLMNDSFKIIYRSPSAERSTGWTNEDLLNSDEIGKIHPDDLKYAKGITRYLLLNPKKPIPTLFRSQHKNGHYIWLEGIANNLLDDEYVNAIVFNLRDVTPRIEAEAALSKSEKLYRNLFDNLLSGFAYCKAIFTNDVLKDYHYLTVNSEYERLTGFKDIAGKKISEIMPELLTLDPNYADIVTRVSLTGKPEKFETFVEPMNKWLSISLYSPEKGYFIGLVDNISERKEAEQKVRKINIELEKRVKRRTEQLRVSNEELESFSYSVSHDLRAPLRAIIGFTAILEEEYSSRLDDEAKRITAIIKKNTEKMGNLIDDLLTFSRMQRQHIEKNIIDTNELVQQVIESVEKKNCPGDINWVVHSLHPINGDLNAMRQVWINLIFNAVKYSGSKATQQIEISSYIQGTDIVFLIKDNGVGFDQKYYDKLFKVFQRLHSAEEFEGTGVGLAIVEKIISKHGGKVWAEGEVDKGACFYFSLPR